MTAKQKKQTFYSERQNLRREGVLPDLYSVTRPPTVPATTKSEVSDHDIGLTYDPISQQRAEEFIRAALAFRTREAEQAAKRRRAFAPIAVRIATLADDEEPGVMVRDVLETMTPARARFEA